MDESDHANTSEILNWNSRIHLSLANHDANSNAPLNSSHGMVMVFNGGQLGFGIQMVCGRSSGRYTTDRIFLLGGVTETAEHIATTGVATDVVWNLDFHQPTQ